MLMESPHDASKAILFVCLEQNDLRLYRFIGQLTQGYAFVVCECERPAVFLIFIGYRNDSVLLLMHTP